MFRFKRFFLVGATAAATLGAAAGVVRADGPANFMMRATVKGQVLEGQPLSWTKSKMWLLGRDGALYEFNPGDAKKAKKIAARYAGYTSSEMKSLLLQEFDRTYTATTTQHFVVLHPRGEWQAWADRLEGLYRSFTHYMSVRGFRPSDPPTPLPAVVFRNQADYYRHAAASGTPLMPGTLGHYSPQTNRIYLYDISESTGDAEWLTNAETIIHEATHQTAYNVGVHRRFAAQPRWLVEGLAMMFEAPGVWGAASIQSRSARINEGRLNDFRATEGRRPVDWLLRLVATDDVFQTDPARAYAESWVLTFYLCESRPQEYTKLLAKVGRRRAFSEYGSPARVADFKAQFGADLKILDSQLRRFMEQVD